MPKVKSNYMGTFKSFSALFADIPDFDIPEQPPPQSLAARMCGCYQLTQLNWKEAYGKPGGFCAFLPPRIFLLCRLLFFVAWVGINAYAVRQLIAMGFPMQYYPTKLTSWAAVLLKSTWR